MAFWASQLISRLFQQTSMLAHYYNNWKPAAEACLPDYPGNRLHAVAKPKKIQCLYDDWYGRFSNTFFLTVMKVMKLPQT